MTDIRPGYMGYIEYDGEQIKFTDCNIAPRQEVVTPDVAHGNYDRTTWYYGAASIEGSASGPVDEFFTNSIWKSAFDREGTCGDLNETSMTVYYFCGGGDGGITFDNVLINSCTISASAGDIANWSFDVIGAKAPSSASSSPGGVRESRILTWDKLGVTVSQGASPVPIDADLIQSIELTVSNNVTPAYKLGSDDLFPYQLIAGVRTITGSVTVYNIGDPSTGPDSWDSYSTGASGTISIDFLGVDAKVNFHRVQPQGQVGPITSTYAFTGTGKQD